MGIISYAQNLEDVMLYRALKHVERGFYIDVGAQHPINDSVTKAFYDLGWRGINIEPVIEYFNLLQQHRPNDINLNIAVGAHKGKVVLHEVLDTGASSVIKNYAESYARNGYQIKSRTVTCTTLDTLCAKNKVGTIHFLKIDVEGAERSVIEGFSFTKVRPWIVVVEATIPNSQADISHEWEPLITSKDYKFVYFDGLNRYYIALEQARLQVHFTTPPNIFDGYIPYQQWLAQQELASEKEQRELMSAQLQLSQQELASEKEQHKALNDQIEHIYSSVSWRITAPLRQIHSKLKGLLVMLVAILIRISMKIARFFASFPWIRKIIIQLLKCFMKSEVLRKIGRSILANQPEAQESILRFTRSTPLSISTTTTWTNNSINFSISMQKYNNANQEIFDVLKAADQCLPIKNPHATKKHTFFYWIDHTSKEPNNTGVQRLTRCLARGLIELDLDITFVCWDEDKKALIKATRSYLQHLSLFNGPQFSDEFLSRYTDNPVMPAIPEERTSLNKFTGNWLIIPEVTHITNHNTPQILDVIDHAKKYGLKTAFIFYDAIPLKLEQYANMSKLHADYMQHISLADLLIPISRYAAEDLVNFYCTHLHFHKNTLPMIRPVLLSGECLSSQRTHEYQQSEEEMIILSVGTIEPRKNQITLVKAFNNICLRYKEHPMRLILCGMRWTPSVGQERGFAKRESCYSYSVCCP